jgi:hypothetical protein
MDSTVKCPSCNLPNPEGNRFCGDCGASLEHLLPAGIQREVERAVSSRLKDAKVVEIEISQAIVARVTDWAKLFAFLVGIPLTILAAVLGYLGFHTYNDFAASVDLAKKEALAPLQKTKDEATKQYNELQTRLNQNQALNSRVSEISQKLEQASQELAQTSKKVAQIEQFVRFQPSDVLTPQLQQELQTKFGQFYAYLKSVGFSLVQPPPTFFVDSSLVGGYYTGPPENKIVLSPKLGVCPRNSHLMLEE